MSVISARSFWVPVMVTTLVATFFATLLEREGRQYLRLVREQSRLEARLARIKAQNRQLRIERTELLTDLGAVERAAREDLNLVAPGASVVVAEDVPPPPAPAPEPPHLTPLEEVTIMPGFTERVTLGALAGSAVLFLFWNVMALLWTRLLGDRAEQGRRPEIATMPEAEPDRKNAA